jgi:hypothetical protein
LVRNIGVSPPRKLFLKKTHDLVVRLLGGVLVAVANRVGHTSFQMVPRTLASDGLEGLLDRVHLVEDVSAVAILLDHSLKAPKLALNAAETGLKGHSLLVVDLHGPKAR